mmetsp:Transcript_59353/g.173590  ORF Transcript_59353/g.173590 Transcript_59353/m.173590 type:complete len:206 (-) Transcript_59353:518-1135(-)
MANSPIAPVHQEPNRHQHRKGREEVDLVIAQVDSTRDTPTLLAWLQLQETAKVFIGGLCGVDVKTSLRWHFAPYPLEKCVVAALRPRLPLLEAHKPVARVAHLCVVLLPEHEVGRLDLIDGRAAALQEPLDGPAKQRLEGAEEQRPGQQMQADAQVARQYHPGEEPRDEAVHGSLRVVVRAPVQHDDLGIGADLHDGPEKTLCAI